MIPLPAEFRHENANYHRIAKEGNAAIYKITNSYARANSSWRKETFLVVHIEMIPKATMDGAFIVFDKLKNENSKRQEG